MLGNKLKSKDDKIEAFFPILQISSVYSETGKDRNNTSAPQISVDRWDEQAKSSLCPLQYHCKNYLYGKK